MNDDDNFEILSLAAVTRNVLEFLRAAPSSRSKLTIEEAQSEQSATSPISTKAGLIRQASHKLGD